MSAMRIASVWRAAMKFMHLWTWIALSLRHDPCNVVAQAGMLEQDVVGCCIEVM